MELKAKTNFTPPEAAAPVVIEQVFAEKPGGGIVVTNDEPILQGTAVYADGEKFKPIKAVRLVKANATADTTITIAKGSNIAANDNLGYGTKSVKATAIDTSNAEYDVVTITMGVDIPKGGVLYEASSASATGAKPKATPIYVIGNDIPEGSGDCPVRLINGANLRKETAPIAPEVAALIPTINLV